VLTAQHPATSRLKKIWSKFTHISDKTAEKLSNEYAFNWFAHNYEELEVYFI